MADEKKVALRDGALAATQGIETIMDELEPAVAMMALGQFFVRNPQYSALAGRPSAGISAGAPGPARMAPQ